MKVYLNNKFIDEEKATINIKDRGLLLGDSIFDTLLYNKNKIILSDFHFARFNKSIRNNYRFIKFFELFKSLNVIKDLEDSLEKWNYDKLNETDKISRYIKEQLKNYDFS